MVKKTLILGASLNSERYSNRAVKDLLLKGFNVVAIGSKKGLLSGIEVKTKLDQYENIHTVSIYINKDLQKYYYQYILKLKPSRVIFNPGTENPDFYKKLTEHSIYFEESCTLVLLSTNQY